MKLRDTDGAQNVVSTISPKIFRNGAVPLGWVDATPENFETIANVLPQLPNGQFLLYSPSGKKTIHYAHTRFGDAVILPDGRIEVHHCEDDFLTDERSGVGDWRAHFIFAKKLLELAGVK